ncbi:hypothetical protein EA187_02360 [Lujinxingia sediminis]|uniref:ABM domain-containing protein n=1 Tax=Lujinxingia sediminis TaxID=2480984 RepID=A0ABY0CXZ8_9DELT|nr:hypothetical protein [Lujinxingia sediminis]RVU48300.1 hypothetical protein EA187_02360 [Lujinxingia sediminis]
MHLFALITLLSAATFEPHCPSSYSWPEPTISTRLAQLLPTLTLSVTTALESRQRLDEQARETMAAPGLLDDASALNHADERRPTVWLLSATWRSPELTPKRIDEVAPVADALLPQLNACLLLLELDAPAGYTLLEPQAAIDRWLEIQALRAFITGHSPRGGAR